MSICLKYVWLWVSLAQKPSLALHRLGRIRRKYQNERSWWKLDRHWGFEPCQVKHPVQLCFPFTLSKKLFTKWKIFFIDSQTFDLGKIGNYGTETMQFLFLKLFLRLKFGPSNHDNKGIWVVSGVDHSIAIIDWFFVVLRHLHGSPNSRNFRKFP